jgi:hypothetical protein
MGGLLVLFEQLDCRFPDASQVSLRYGTHLFLRREVPLILLVIKEVKSVIGTVARFPPVTSLLEPLFLQRVECRKQAMRWKRLILWDMVQVSCRVEKRGMTLVEKIS